VVTVNLELRRQARRLMLLLSLFKAAMGN